MRRVRRRKSGNEMGRRRVRRKRRGGKVIERRRGPGSPATEGAGGGRALAAGQLPVVPEKKKNLLNIKINWELKEKEGWTYSVTDLGMGSLSRSMNWLSSLSWFTYLSWGVQCTDNS